MNRRRFLASLAGLAVVPFLPVAAAPAGLVYFTPHGVLKRHSTGTTVVNYPNGA